MASGYQVLGGAGASSMNSSVSAANAPQPRMVSTVPRGMSTDMAKRSVTSVCSAQSPQFPKSQTLLPPRTFSKRGQSEIKSEEAEDRHTMERLAEELENCNEAEATRRAELAQQVGLTLSTPSADAAEAQKTQKSSDGPWSGEERLFDEGFTAKAMVELTNRIKSSCAEFDDNLGGPAVVSTRLMLLLLTKVEAVLRRRGSKALIELQPPPGERVIIVGDLHGQLKDFLWIFFRYGLPSESGGNVYLFNGDIADRGRFSVEIYALVIGWMLVFPGAVFLNRGNHEDVLVNTSRCGGFYDECISKYPAHGRLIFEAFGRLFATLPLAYLLGPSRAKILVVHGGLPRVPSQMISSLKHMAFRGPTVPMRTQNLADVIVKDCLWSDPKESMGHEVSTRGSSLMSFGPDVTLKFCHEELIGLVVRSHEVPPTGEGFAFMHQNRLCTVFSASNYKGMEHNSGAVLIVTSAELAVGNLAGSVRPECFYAPLLSKACAVEFELPKEMVPDEEMGTPAARSNREQTRKLEAAKAEEDSKLFSKEGDPTGLQIKEEAVDVIAMLVVAHKEELWQSFWEKDIGLRADVPSRSGFVSFKVWKDVCQTVLGHKVCWDAIGSILGVVEALPPHRGAVDYNRFLHRFHVCLRQDGPVRAAWIDGVLAELVDKLLGLSVDELMDCFDQDKNGRLTITELSEAFRMLDSGMTQVQVRALFLTFAVYCEDTIEDDIEVSSFLSSLIAAARNTGDTGQTTIHERARSVWPRWASRYLRHLGKEIWEMGGLDLLAQFKIFDEDRSGLLEPGEFVKIMQRLQSTTRNPAEMSLPDAALHELAHLADFDGSGSVSYVEILLSLQPEDTVSGGHVRFDLFEQICSCVWGNKEALLSVFHRIDTERRMKVDAAGITRALEEMNSIVGNGHKRPLLPFQIEALVSHLNFDEECMVNYQEFLDAFEVRDCVSKRIGSLA